LLSAGGSEFCGVFAKSHDAMIVSLIDFGHDDFCYFVFVVFLFCLLLIGSHAKEDFKTETAFGYPMLFCQLDLSIYQLEIF
jgi:hypothetical protein